MRPIHTRSFLTIVLLQLVLASCLTEEDPGPLQLEERDFYITDFDRVDVGDAFHITISQGPNFGVHVRGDRRNLDDLSVQKSGSTLRIGYDNSGEHRHTTYFTITMPSIAGGNFSGACNFTVSGFNQSGKEDIALSDASEGQLSGDCGQLRLVLSGASRLSLSGKSETLIVNASGASELRAFAFSADHVEAEASGASVVNLFAAKTLKAVASGASAIFFRGNPSVDASVSGASTVRED